VTLGGRDLSGLSTRERREGGIGYVPEDRHRQGLLLSAPLWENRVLGHQGRKPSRRGPWIDRKAARADTERIMREYDVRAPSPDTMAAALSGGNQQKLIVGREILATPTFLIAAHPTRGIDVGAQARVWDDLREARKAGLATLLISADLDELIGLSDTLLVLYGGKVVAELDPATVTPADLGAYMTGAHAHEAGATT
jgi:simple sugar transport system ATP-binding protein